MTHPANLAMINATVFEGEYEGLFRRNSAATWLAIYSHDRRASIAIRRARDGEEGVSFRAADGVVWNLQRAD